MRGRKSADTVDIDAVRTRFEIWRQTREGKARIPDELWSAAVEVARRDGVNQTATALHLDGGKLKRRIPKMCRRWRCRIGRWASVRPGAAARSPCMPGTSTPGRN